MDNHMAQLSSQNIYSSKLMLATAVVAALFASPLLADKPIPHGTIVRQTGPGIVEAFFSCPTDRYPHGVLGDRIEGGCMVVTDDASIRHTRILPEDQVFEDLTPRIADIDGDGKNDVVVILSSSTAGSAIAVYTIKEEKLSLLAATPYIGRPNRWLAPAGIADFNGDGQNDIAYVQTPHIGGTLKLLTLKEGALVLLGSAAGVSNHSIGSRTISMSKVLDYNEDGVADLALPNQSGSRIWIFTMGEKLELLDDIPMDAEFFIEAD